MAKEWKIFIDRYLDTLKLRYEKTTERTLKIRRSSLSIFVKYLLSIGTLSPGEISRQTVSSFGTTLLTVRNAKGRPYGASSRMRLLVDMKNFIAFLQKEGELLTNPALDVELPKLSRRISREAPKLEEIDRMAGVASTLEAALIETLYGTGIRANEIVKLRIEDIDFNNGFIMVREGKYGKDRSMPVNERALLKLRELIGRRRKGFVFTRGRKAMGVDKVRKIVAKVLKEANIRKHYIPHSFRYACATHMLKNGADIRYIQEMLGHEKLSTTQGYTKVVKGDLKRMLRKFHPREISYEEAVINGQ